MSKQQLATILRPSTIKDIIGQTHLLNKNGIVYRMVLNNELFSIIFHGKPGIGKTSLAISLANDLKVPYQIFNAANDKKEYLVDIIKTAKVSKNYVVIIEEIHRLNKDKQDILLSLLEEGKICMFATTTENPFFVINPSIRSRCQILQLKPISIDEMILGLTKIVNNLKLKNINKEIIEIISYRTLGDLRSALNIIDIIRNLYSKDKIDNKLLSSIMNQSYVTNSHYDDEFHDLKSALHKSIRGSDVDAALHYLGRLIISQDLVSISRRMIMVAYEDIGLANPNLCMRVYLGIQAAKEVGFPEASTILGDLVIEMALSPKSNSGYLAISKAATEAANGDAFEIPYYLKSSAKYLKNDKSKTQKYKYPHDYQNAWVEQQYLPDKLVKSKYYIPAKHSKNEEKLQSWLASLKRYKD